METGLISQSAEQYHAAAGVSRSSLKWISAPKTPAHFKAKFIDKLIPDEETPALRMGSIVHRCLLEPETVTDAFHVRPAGLNFTTKEGRAWKEAHEDRPILTPVEATHIAGMRASILAHSTAARIIQGSDCERSAFAEDKGMTLKSRFDCLPKTGNVIADLKTCEDADLASVEKAMANYAYYVQAAFYLKVANLIGLKRDVFVFIFVEKTPPYAVACYTPADVVLEAGRMIVERDLQVLRNCYADNSWPGYASGVQPCGLPAYLMKQLEEIA